MQVPNHGLFTNVAVMAHLSQVIPYDLGDWHSDATKGTMGKRKRANSFPAPPVCISLALFSLILKFNKKDDWGQVSCYDIICRLKFASHSKDVWDQYQSFAEVLYMYVTEKSESEFWNCY